MNVAGVQVRGGLQQCTRQAASAERPGEVPLEGGAHFGKRAVSARPFENFAQPRRVEVLRVREVVVANFSRAEPTAHFDGVFEQTHAHQNLTSAAAYVEMNADAAAAIATPASNRPSSSTLITEARSVPCA